MDFYVGYSKDLSSKDMFKGMDVSLVLNNLNDEDYLAGAQEGAYYLGAECTATVTLKLDF